LTCLRLNEYGQGCLGEDLKVHFKITATGVPQPTKETVALDGINFKFRLKNGGHRLKAAAVRAPWHASSPVFYRCRTVKFSCRIFPSCE
jgi:hypothetical protein